jgi:LacI family transcriptional regulator
MFHRHLKRPKGNYVGCDNYLGIRKTIEHLYSLGHSRIGFITGPAEFSTAQERLEAFNSQRERLRIDMDPALVKEGGYDRRKTVSCVNEFISNAHPPTAIMAANDLMALQVLDCLQKNGYRVPEDFSITGFDDIPMASHSSIQMTTVNINADKGANVLIDTIIEQIKGKQPQQERNNIILETTFVPRKTTTVPRKETASPSERSESIQSINLFSNT